MIRPASLLPGSRIAILAPASAVKAEYVVGAEAFLRNRGFEVEIMPGTIGVPSGTYSAPESLRRASLLEAYSRADISAILCARGGYGCVHLLDSQLIDAMRANPKWLIGFSDISALHAASLCAGVMSIHASMAKELTLHPQSLPTRTLMAILEGGSPAYAESVSDGIEGEASGTLIGGNLAVLSGLAATPFDLFSIPLSHPCILFVEDIAEAIYAVERMFWRLHLAGVLKNIKGLIIGKFTEYHPDRNYPSMEAMLRARLATWHLDNIPVAIGFPLGHVDDNLPLIEGAHVDFRVQGSTAYLSPHTD